MKKTIKRIAAVAMACCLVAATMATSAFAAEKKYFEKDIKTTGGATSCMWVRDYVYTDTYQATGSPVIYYAGVKGKVIYGSMSTEWTSGGTLRNASGTMVKLTTKTETGTSTKNYNGNQNGGFNYYNVFINTVSAAYGNSTYSRSGNC